MIVGKELGGATVHSSRLDEAPLLEELITRTWAICVRTALRMVRVSCFCILQLRQVNETNLCAKFDRRFWDSFYRNKRSTRVGLLLSPLLMLLQFTFWAFLRGVAFWWDHEAWAHGAPIMWPPKPTLFYFWAIFRLD